MAGNPPTPNDPRRDLDDLVAEARSLRDAPQAEAPQIPELLQTPVQRPASMQPKSSPLSGFADVSKSLAIGLDFLFAAAAGGVLGYLIDRWRGSFPLGTVIGAGIGFLAGTARLIQRLNKDEAVSKKGGRRK